MQQQKSFCKNTRSKGVGIVSDLSCTRLFLLQSDLTKLWLKLFSSNARLFLLMTTWYLESLKFFFEIFEKKLEKGLHLAY